MRSRQSRQLPSLPRCSYSGRMLRYGSVMERAMYTDKSEREDPGQGPRPQAPPSLKEDPYWRDSIDKREYAESGLSWEDYQPAYRFGYEAHSRIASHGGSFDELEDQLRRDWE